MGNCLKNSEKVGAKNEEEKPERTEPKMRSQEGRKKRVDFKLVEESVEKKVVAKLENPEENEANSEVERSREKVRGRRKKGEGERRGEVVRVRVVVTKKELQRIVRGEDLGYSNVEEMIAGFKSRGRRVSEIRSSQTGDINGGWRPDLENIAEERC